MFSFLFPVQQLQGFQVKLMSETGSLLQDEVILDPLVNGQLYHLVVTEHWPRDPAQDQSFVLACRENRLKEVEELLQRPLSPNATDEGGSGAMYAASLEGHLQCVLLLLEAGADKDLPGTATHKAPLHAAAS